MTNFEVDIDDIVIFTNVADFVGFIDVGDGIRPTDIEKDVCWTQIVGDNLR